MVENQRARLINGMIATVAEIGFGKATIATVTGPAKISRRTFYEFFDNKEDCYRAAYEASFDFLRGTTATAAAAEQWPDSVRAGLEALLEALAAHPDLATFFLISPPGVGDEVAARHHQAMLELVEALVAGAPATEGGDLASKTRAEALAGGLARLTAIKASAGKADELPALLPDLVELFLRPYIGSDAVQVAWGDGRLDRR